MGNNREPGIIVHSKGVYHEERIDAPTCLINVQYETRGGTQGFGGLHLGNGLDKAWEREVCEAFGVKHLMQLEGKPVFILTSFGRYHEPIEGLEDAMTGKRFTITGFRRRNCGFTGTKLEEELQSALRAIEVSRKRLDEANRAYLQYAQGFTDWETF